MNHTVPYTRPEQDKTIANAVNHAFRHCRIGKVTEKPVAPLINGNRMDYWPQTRRMVDILVGSPDTWNGCFVTSASD